MKYDLQLIGFITTFENLTRASVKDAFLDKHHQLVFVVKQGEAGKAIGKHGSMIRKVSYLLKKKIKIIEYNDNVIEFVKNAIDPLKASLEEDGDTIILHADSTQTKAMLIGRNRENLEQLNALVQRYFPTKHVKVM